MEKILSAIGALGFISVFHAIAAAGLYGVYKGAKESLKKKTFAKSIGPVIAGTFFSFGFDVPEFLSYTKAEFSEYLQKFTDLYKYIFLYPKPVIAALNGHTIAGACMLAISCDRRIMVSDKAKISLNEVNFGSMVFTGSTEMLRFCVGSRHASNMLYSGAMYSAQEAEKIGLIDMIAQNTDLMNKAEEMALDLGKKAAPAFAGIKSLLRTPAAEAMKQNEADSIKKFVDIWYSDSTWENLKNIKIH